MTTRLCIACKPALALTTAGVKFKRNSWFVVLAENVKIQYFLKKIFNSHIYLSVDNDTMKILKEIKFVKSQILEKLRIEYFPKKVLKFDVFCRDNKSWVPQPMYSTLLLSPKVFLAFE